MKKLVKAYLKLHWKAGAVFGLCFFICLLVFYLHGIQTEVVYYAFELCGVVGLFGVSIDFYQYRKKHKSLELTLSEIEVSVERLPYAVGIIEKDYQKLIQTLFERKHAYELKNAIERNEMLDYYTMWVHQIKTPIAAMSILLQTQEDVKYKGLQVELFKIEQYVEMVLSYLRLDSMSADLKLEKISLNEIVKSAIRKYSSVFIAKKLKIVFKEPSNLILTDKKWISFVIEQILSNAIKYTASGTISIYVEDKDGLVIEDTGIGIQEEDLPRVFERGFTGYNGRNHKKSTGLGLYLCKKILDKLAHKIEIQSQPEVGTRVMVDLSSSEERIE